MSESTQFMFTQAIQPTDSTKFVRGVAELAREKQRKALMDLERAKQNAAQIANSTAGYKIDAIPEAWRGEWQNYYNEQKKEIVKSYSSNDPEAFQDALDRLNKLSNLYTTLSTATPESVSQNMQTLKNLQDAAFEERYNKSLGVFESVDDSNLAQQVAQAEMKIQNPFGEDYEFKIVNGEPVWEGKDGSMMGMNDYVSNLSLNAADYGPRTKRESPVDVSGLSNMLIDEMEKTNKPWTEDEAKRRVDRYMTGKAGSDRKKMFRYAIMSEIGFDALSEEDINKILDGDWESTDYADDIRTYINDVIAGSDYNSEKVAEPEAADETTTEETPVDDPAAPPAP